jgi:hypothetical protein
MVLEVDVADHEITWSCSEYRNFCSNEPLGWLVTGEIPEPKTDQKETIRTTFTVDEAGRLKDVPSWLHFEAKTGGIAVVKTTLADKDCKGRFDTTPWMPFPVTATLGDKTLGASFEIPTELSGSAGSV